MTIFWDDAPCSLVETDQSFRGAYCLYHQGDHRPDHKIDRFTDHYCSSVISVTEARSLNVLQCCHYPQGNERQLVVNEGSFIFFISATFYYIANIILGENQNLPSFDFDA
jgi:hypothetical protein